MKNNWSHIRTPTLLIDEKRVRRNIHRMVTKAARAGKVFRPHFKTHQSRAIGEWFRDEGVSHITVSSVGMAEYFASNGWNNITIAFPCNLRQIDRIDELASKIDISILVDSEDVAEQISKLVNHKLRVFVEIDTGSERTGIRYDNPEAIMRLYALIEESEFLEFAGIYSHAGHTYACRSREEVKKTANEAIDRLEQVAAVFEKKIGVCYGDTPGCTVLDDFGDIITDLSPGNFVFYDMMQVHIGVCEVDDIGVVLCCPVVTEKTIEPVVTLYGGAVHFSKEQLDDKSFGKVAMLNPSGWEDSVVGSLERISQEHGMVRLDGVTAKAGDVLAILPVHSCLTAECMAKYLTLNGVYLDHYQKSR
ncbi:alanine racemase [Fulvivirga sedimenti]|uniref:Alanine racemase n=1 Tax=Fulvivirga sedimenti TaxID=2879465 RepID=A0A9X1KXQ8_9BACT|nr:alanine racemase [Fulvivirga sedimenti]MCA6075289.1 alanine racemase [Fulvivirga sedimenti]MCA6076466.1 alanine racemase [Fulvivirga sedimenti]MCA6077594.1 alanine racemase [Fulvivirga sedimenti]